MQKVFINHHHRKFRVALIGCGRISVYHIAALKDLPNVEIVAVCDLDEAMAQQRAAEHDIPHVFTDAEAMLSHVLPDVVHVLTPPRSHVTLVQLAAKYGAHLYVEKPMAANAADAEAMVKVARGANVQLCPGHCRLFDPPFLEAKRRLARGDIGQVISVRAEQGFTYEAAARAAVIPWSYQYDWGIFDNLIPHPLYVAMHFLDGEPEEWGAPQVVATNRNQVREAAVEELRISIPGKSVIAEVALSLNNQPETNRLEIVGTRGRIVIDFNSFSVQSCAQNGLPSAVARFLGGFINGAKLAAENVGTLWKIVSGKTKRYHGLRNLITAFYEALTARQPMPVSAESCWQSMQMMDAIKVACADSVKTRTTVAVTAKAELIQPRALVTGASGFLGRRLAEVMSERGIATRATTRLLSRAKAMPKVEWVQANLNRAEDLRQALAGIETVYHVAAMSGPPGSLKDYETANVNGTVLLARLAAEAGVKHFVYVSSMSVYGPPPRGWRYLDESAPLETRADERGVYTQTKLSAEQALLELVPQLPQMRIVALRPGGIYGPGNKLPIGKFPLLALRNRPLITGGKKVAAGLTYVDNVIDALLAAGSTETASGKIYNLIDEADCDQAQLARTLAEVTHGRIRPIFVPYAVVWSLLAAVDALTYVRTRKPGTARYRLRRTLSDMRFRCEAARTELNWEPRVSLAEGLRRTLIAAGELPSDAVLPTNRTAAAPRSALTGNLQVEAKTTSA